MMKRTAAQRWGGCKRTVRQFKGMDSRVPKHNIFRSDSGDECARGNARKGDRIMLTDDDRRYYVERAKTERERAAAAPDPYVASVHANLATRYEALSRQRPNMLGSNAEEVSRPPL